MPKRAVPASCDTGAASAPRADSLQRFVEEEADRQEAARQARRLLGADALRRENTRLRDQLLLTQRELEVALALPKSLETYELKATASSRTGEAVACLVGSDWHIEELVKPEMVSGLNRYNLEESKRRAALFFQNGLRLVRVHQTAIAINQMVVAFLGDMISGSIHEDLAESNLLGPTDAILRCAEYITSGLDFLLSETKNEGMTFLVVCKSGNHGRMTQKMRVQTADENSLERILYALVAGRYRNETRISFDISPGYHTYTKILGKMVRWHHGHRIKYGGGVGGIMVPAYRIIARWERGKHADLDIFGHHHTHLDGGIFLSNGSMIGYNPFAQEMGYAHEPPSQLWFLIDKKRGRRALDPIFFEKGEG